MNFKDSNWEIGNHWSRISRCPRGGVAWTISSFTSIDQPPVMCVWQVPTIQPDTTVKAPLTRTPARQGRDSSLCYLQWQASHPVIRHRCWPWHRILHSWQYRGFKIVFTRWEERCDRSHRRDFELCDYKYFGFTEPFLSFLELIWVPQRATCSKVRSDLDRTKLFLTMTVRSFRVIHVCITHANLPTSSYSSALLMSCLATISHTRIPRLSAPSSRTGVHRGVGNDVGVSELQRRYKSSVASVMVGVPAVWESIRKGIVAKNQFGESNHESHFQQCYVSTPRLLYSLQINPFWPKWELLPEIDCALIALSGGAAISQLIFWLLCWSPLYNSFYLMKANDSLGCMRCICHHFT